MLFVCNTTFLKVYIYILQCVLNVLHCHVRIFLLYKVLLMLTDIIKFTKLKYEWDFTLNLNLIIF